MNIGHQVLKAAKHQKLSIEAMEMLDRHEDALLDLGYDSYDVNAITEPLKRYIEGIPTPSLRGD